MLLFGGIFFSVGALFTVLGIGMFLSMTGYQRQEMWVLWLTFSAMGLLCLCVGIIAFMCYRKGRMAMRMALKNPDTIIKNCEVVGHVEYPGVAVNGMLPLHPIVEGMIHGEVRQLEAMNSIYNMSKIPVGSHADVYVRGTDVYLDERSIRLF